MNHVLKRTLTGLAVGAAVICAILFAPVPAMMPACIVLATLAAVEVVMLALRKRREEPVKALAASVFFTALVFLAFLTLPRIAEHFGTSGNAMLLYVIAVIKFSDVGGFAFGLTSAKVMAGGNHKMCPTVSPNKSWEGLLGSVFASCVASCAFMGVTGFGRSLSLALGVTAACVGTMGDLIESVFKRWVGVKDSSTMKITNGMGGFLDMFDSLLLAVPVLAVLMGCFR